MDGLSGSRVGTALSEALGLSSPGAGRVAEQQWQQQQARDGGGRGATARDAAIPAPRLAAAERAGAAGEAHPRGRFLDLKA